MSKESPIGFFDSGVGGLSVYSRFRNILPNENTIYFGDLKNMPYGSKTKAELIGYAKNILNFFERKRVKAVVIACNTSSAVVYDEIKNDYSFKIYPIIQTCAQKVANMNFKTIGVFATVATTNSNAYKIELEKYNKNLTVVQEACPYWTSMVESGNLSSAVVEADVEFHMNNILAYNPDKIILGCTHYPYLLDILTKFAPSDKFIDPAEIFVEYIKEDLTTLGMLNENNIPGIEEFYVSANPNDFVKNSKLFYDVCVTPYLISF